RPRADHDAVFDRHSRADVDEGVDLHAVADDDVVSDVRLLADDALLADPGAVPDMDVVPDGGAVAKEDILLDQRRGMNAGGHQLSLTTSGATSGTAVATSAARRRPPAGTAVQCERRSDRYAAATPSTDASASSALMTSASSPRIARAKLTS